MANLLRQIVAGPRARHPEAGLDLCYVTDNIIATSGPSQTYPQRAYRNPLDRLVAFLDSKHDDNWAIWEFRAEGTGYPDRAVYDRIRHYPWPDHHPPPFRLIPMIMASMRDWLHGGSLDGSSDAKPGDGRDASAAAAKSSGKKKGRVVVVHCKAGKGRSGTVSCSYLISECGWKPEDALARFTERRMRPGFGAGVSIPSQVRWVGYVDRWTRSGKRYVDREIEIVEVHVWGLRDGVRVDIEAFVDEGKKIRAVHTFKREERVVIEGNAPSGGGIGEMVQDFAGYGIRSNAAPEEAEADTLEKAKNGNGAGPGRTATEPVKHGKPKKATTKAPKLINRENTSTPENLTSLKAKSFAAAAPSAASSQSQLSLSSGKESEGEREPGGMAVILLPETPIRIPNSDVNISVERRNKAQLGLTMVTAVGHAWFNAYFEGNGPERDGRPEASGVFEIEWDAMDGIKGSLRKGTRALDRLAVVWRAVGADDDTAGPEAAGTRAGGEEVAEPAEGTPVPQMAAADWKGDDKEDPDVPRTLGLRPQSPDSASVSKASSINQELLEGDTGSAKDTDSMAGVRYCGPHGEEDASQDLTGLETSSGAGSSKAAADDAGEKVKSGDVGPDVSENPDTASGTTVKNRTELAE